VNLKNIKILAVDDDPDILNLLDVWLRESVGSLHTAQNTQTALSMFEELLPDIVFLDVSMPGPNGLVALRKIRAICSREKIKTRILILSARNTEQDFDNALVYGADGYLTKPINKQELFEKLEAMCT
jgi:DNA-binding response OmpR family regulator